MLQVLARRRHRHDAVERRLAGDDERRHVDAARARCRTIDRLEQLHAPRHPRRREHVRQRRASRGGRRGRRPGTSPVVGRGDLRGTSAATPSRRAATAAAARAGRTCTRAFGLPRRRQRRHEHERRRALRIARGERRRNQAAVRHAADRRRVDAGRVERLAHLLDVAVEPARLVEPPAARRLVGERERDDAAALRERVDRRLHPLPASLDARDDDDRRPAAAVDDLHGTNSTRPQLQPDSD